MAFIGQTTLAAGSPDLILSGIPCDVSVSVGDWVRMSSGVAVKASADSVENSNVFGVVESKTNGTTANIRVMGLTGDLFSGLDESKEYYLSADTPGAMVTIPPSDTGQVLLKLGQPYTNSKFLVLKGSRMVRS
jgi:hypothetical protein